MIHAYVRVSTVQQDTTVQRKAIEQWLDGKATWYKDQFTGRTMDRPGWNRLRLRLKRGDTVVVHRLDRLGRTTHELAALFREFTERGIRLVSISDSLDLSTPTGRLLAHMLASIAQFDNEVRGERIKAGQARARANGKRIGGKRKGERSKRVRGLEKPARALYRDGSNITEIAQALGVSRPTVYSLLELV